MFQPPTTHDGQTAEHATHAMGAADFSVYEQFRVEVVEGPDRGAVLVSSGDRVVIGTHESANLSLSDPAVSRFHCQITVEGDQIDLSDLGSRNGTKVGEVSIQVVHLGRSAAIRVGRSVLRFERVGSAIKVPRSLESRFGRVVGRSTCMREVFATLERAARSDSTLLLQGETGTGKDAVATSVHDLSDRAGGPFVVVDCGAISPSLIESELFGHERGAFTGASEARPGAFELAHGGTLFLDEIGELDLELQPKLLRALESRTVTRVGGSQPIAVDVRVIAATNRDLRSEVNRQRFRSDLFYRVAVVELELPPLRDRPEDLPLLIESLLASMNESDHPVASRVLAKDYVDALTLHHWPGNIRELRNHVERCLALRDALPIGAGTSAMSSSVTVEPVTPEPDPDSMLPPVDIDQPLKAGRELWVKYFERQYLAKLLESHNGNVTASARSAGVDRGHFYRLMFRCGLRTPT